MSSSKKRSAEGQVASEKHSSKSASEIEEADLVFEDPFGDEFEEEDVEETREIDDDDVDETGEDSAVQQDVEMEMKPPKQVWRPDVDKLEEGEDLEYDPSAYVMYHSLRAEWPCLSFDFIKDNLGDNRQRFPQTMFLVTGSQADRAEKNKVTLLKLSELHKTQVAADSDGESDDDENLDEDPTIDHVNISHQGCVNRIRSMPQASGIVATMADDGKAHIFDLTSLASSMMSKGPRGAVPTKPTFTFSGHRNEGYAVDFSPSVAGRLATGDCNGKIHVWNCNNNQWQVNNTPFSGHTNSVEDIQWSPTEGTVFASASADKTVRIWDTRGSAPQITFQAHGEDVNVISWNRRVGYLLASGSDDGSFKVWDLRTIGKGNAPLANFTYHKGAVTSIEWAPHDESVLSVASADNQITIWDLSVEADDVDAAAVDPALKDLPPQLLFIHQGQYNVKELHFHPQIPGTIVSTAEDGFNVFKPAITVSS